MKARRAASIVLAFSVLLGTAGCTLSAIQGTQVHYQPSDGTAANIGDVKLRNVIGLSDNGDDISLLMTIVNDGNSDVNVNFQYTDESGEKAPELTVGVEANSSVHIGGGGGQVELVLRDAGATVGGLFPVFVYFGNEVPGEQLEVPILDGSTAAYADLLPGPAPKPPATKTPAP